MKKQYASMLTILASLALPLAAGASENHVDCFTKIEQFLDISPNTTKTLKGTQCEAQFRYDRHLSNQREEQRLLFFTVNREIPNSTTMAHDQTSLLTFDDSKIESCEMVDSRLAIKFKYRPNHSYLNKKSHETVLVRRNADGAISLSLTSRVKQDASFMSFRSAEYTQISDCSDAK